MKLNIKNIIQDIIGIIIALSISALTLASIVAGVYSTGIINNSESLTSFFSLQNTIEEAPQDIIKERDIQLRHNSVIINVKNASLVEVEQPYLDLLMLPKGSNALLISPLSNDQFSLENLKEGDIISYTLNDNSTGFSRISRIYTENNVTYFIDAFTKERIMEDNINGIVVAFTY